MTSHIHEHKQIGFFVTISHFVETGLDKTTMHTYSLDQCLGKKQKKQKTQKERKTYKRPTWKLCLGDWDMICGGKLYINKNDGHEKPMNGCRGQ